MELATLVLAILNSVLLIVVFVAQSSVFAIINKFTEDMVKLRQRINAWEIRQRIGE